jgi:hypothetical protein
LDFSTMDREQRVPESMRCSLLLAGYFMRVLP